MQKVKMYSLAAVTALALSAFVGVAAASATTIKDASGTAYTGAVGVTLKSGTTATFTTSIGTITCDQSSGSGQITNSNGTGYLSSIDWTDSTAGQNCPTTFGILGNPGADTTALDNNGASTGIWDVSASWSSDNTTGSPNGTMSLSASVQIDLTSGQTCFYAATVVGDLYNPDNTASGKSEVVYSGDTLSRQAGSSFGCPSSGTFNATYVVDDGSGGNLQVRS